jgi:hypothetical protein
MHPSNWGAESMLPVILIDLAPDRKRFASRLHLQSIRPAFTKSVLE